MCTVLNVLTLLKPNSRFDRQPLFIFIFLICIYFGAVFDSVTSWGPLCPFPAFVGNS